MNDSDKALCLDTLRALGEFRAAWEDKEGNDYHGRVPSEGDRVIFKSNTGLHDGPRQGEKGTIVKVPGYKNADGDHIVHVLPDRKGEFGHHALITSTGRVAKLPSGKTM